MRAPNNKPTEKAEKRLAGQDDILGEENSPMAEMDINTLLKTLLDNEPIQNKATPVASKHIHTENDMLNIRAIVSEYFDSFLILGYSIDGKRVVIKKCDNDKDEDSLVEVLRFVFMKMIQGN